MRYTTTVTAPADSVFAPDAFAADIGQPYRSGALVSAEVAPDGRTASLTFDVPDDVALLPERDQPHAVAARAALRAAYPPAAERDRLRREYDEAQAAEYADAARDPGVRAVLDVLAPVSEYAPHHRIPVFEFGHEETPNAGDVIDMARVILANLHAAGFRPLPTGDARAAAVDAYAEAHSIPHAVIGEDDADGIEALRRVLAEHMRPATPEEG